MLETVHLNADLEVAKRQMQTFEKEFEKRIRAQWPHYAKNLTDDNIVAMQFFMPTTVNASKPDMIEGDSRSPPKVVTIELAAAARSFLSRVINCAKPPHSRVGTIS